MRLRRWLAALLVVCLGGCDAIDNELEDAVADSWLVEFRKASDEEWTAARPNDGASYSRGLYERGLHIRATWAGALPVRAFWHLEPYPYGEPTDVVGVVLMEGEPIEVRGRPAEGGHGGFEWFTPSVPVEWFVDLAGRVPRFVDPNSDYADPFDCLRRVPQVSLGLELVAPRHPTCGVDPLCSGRYPGWGFVPDPAALCDSVVEAPEAEPGG